MWKCSYLLSRMLSNVHWSFLKKGWRLISSTPVRPKRTVLHTATEPTTLWVRLLSPNLKHTQLRLFFFLPPPSSPTCHPKHKPSKSGPLTTMTGKETHSDHKWTLTTPSPPDLIRETWNWVQLELQVNSLLPLGFSDFIKHFFLPFSPSSLDTEPEGCGSLGLPRVGHSSPSQEEERQGRGELLNPHKHTQKYFGQTSS